MLHYTTSHGTSFAEVSRISIVTFQSPAIASTILRAAGQQRFPYGNTQIILRKQTALWDRLVSAPIKATMDILSAEVPNMQGAFKPDWRQGKLYHWDSLLACWSTDVEHAKIKIQIKPEYVDVIDRNMKTGLRRLRFGKELETDEQSGGHKGRGKGGKSSKGKAKLSNAVPVDESAFRREPDFYRDRLGNLQLAQYPFEVAIKPLKEDRARDHDRQPAHPQQRTPSVKRQSEPRDGNGEPKRRSNTPRRGPYSGTVGVGQDPWAAAANLAQQAASAAAAAAASQPSSGSHEQPLVMGSRIST